MNSILKKHPTLLGLYGWWLAGVLSFGTLHAQETPASLNAEIFSSHLRPDSVPVGGTVEWTVRAAADLQWQWSADSLPSFLLLQGDTVQEDASTAYTFQLMALDTGQFWLPALHAHRSDEHYRTEPQSVRVGLLPEAEGVELADTRPTRDVPFHLSWWLQAYGLYLLGGLILLLALAWLGRYLWIRRRRQPQPSAPAEVRVDPYEEAMRRLRALRSSAPWQEDAKAFYVDLGDLVRLYLEGQTGLPLAELTTDEAIARVQHRWTGAQIEDYRFILTRADVVKFAKGTMDVSDHLSCLDRAEQLIEDFKPQPNEDGLVGE